MTRKDTDTIDQIVIALKDRYSLDGKDRGAPVTALEALEIEPLTDKEQRIFLAAMSKEEKVCKEVDEKYPDREPYEDSLVSVCHSIERKVKRALWQ